MIPNCLAIKLVAFGEVALIQFGECSPHPGMNEGFDVALRRPWSASEPRNTLAELYRERDVQRALAAVRDLLHSPQSCRRRGNHLSAPARLAWVRRARDLGGSGPAANSNNNVRGDMPFDEPFGARLQRSLQLAVFLLGPQRCRESALPPRCPRIAL